MDDGQDLPLMRIGLKKRIRSAESPEEAKGTKEQPGPGMGFGVGIVPNGNGYCDGWQDKGRRTEDVEEARAVMRF
ncbi:hypothetical protein [Roseibium sp.]|uniref:hypothetical protein n=1 Tax=Roseibium sp. TaxID=1936156 RepID=UPI003D11F3C5